MGLFDQSTESPGLTNFGAGAKRFFQGVGQNLQQNRVGVPQATQPQGRVGIGQGFRPVPLDRPAPESSASDLPAWAHEQIRAGGGSPSGFRMEGSQLVSSRSPEQIQADISAHPPITTEAGERLAQQPAAPMAPAAPAAHPMAMVATPGTVAAQSAPQPTTSDPILASMQRAHAALVNRGATGWGSTPQEIASNHAMNVLASGNAIQNYRAQGSAIGQADPGYQAKMLEQIGRNPAALAAFATSRNVSPNDAAAFAQQAAGATINGQSVDQYLAANAKRPLSEKLIGVPSAGNPTVRAALQRHIDTEYADPARWKEEAGQLPALGDYQYNGPLPSLLSGPAALWAHASNSMFGGERNANPALFGVMHQLRLAPPGTVNVGLGPQ